MKHSLCAEQFHELSDDSDDPVKLRRANSILDYAGQLRGIPRRDVQIVSRIDRTTLSWQHYLTKMASMPLLGSTAWNRCGGLRSNPLIGF